MLPNVLSCPSSARSHQNVYLCLSSAEEEAAGTLSGATFSVTTGKEESQKQSLSCVVILCTLSGTKEMPLEKVRAVATLAWKQHCLTSWHRCCSNTFPGKFIALPALNKMVKYLKIQ